MPVALGELEPQPRAHEGGPDPEAEVASLAQDPARPRTARNPSACAVIVASTRTSTEPPGDPHLDYGAPAERMSG